MVLREYWLIAFYNYLRWIIISWGILFIKKVLFKEPYVSQKMTNIIVLMLERDECDRASILEVEKMLNELEW